MYYAFLADTVDRTFATSNPNFAPGSISGAEGSWPQRIDSISLIAQSVPSSPDAPQPAIHCFAIGLPKGESAGSMPWFAKRSANTRY
jgi:hypothetical protein